MAARIPDNTQAAQSTRKPLEKKFSENKISSLTKGLLQRTNSQTAQSSPSTSFSKPRSYSVASDMPERKDLRCIALFHNHSTTKDFHRFGDELVKLSQTSEQRLEIVNSLIILRQNLKPHKVEVQADSALKIFKESDKEALMLFFCRTLAHLYSHFPTGLDLLYEYVIKHPQDQQMIAELIASEVSLVQVESALVYFEKKNMDGKATPFITLIGTKAIENELESKFQDYYSGSNVKKWADEIAAFCKRELLNRYCPNALYYLKLKIESSSKEKEPLIFFFDGIINYVLESSNWPFLREFTSKHDFVCAPLAERIMNNLSFEQLLVILATLTQLELDHSNSETCLREDSLVVELGKQISRRFLKDDLIRIKESLDKSLQQVDLTQLCVKGELLPVKNSKEMAQKVEENLSMLRKFMKSWLKEFFQLTYSDKFYALIRCRSMLAFGSKEKLKEELISKFWLFEIVIPFLIGNSDSSIYQSVLLDFVKAIKFVAIPPDKNNNAFKVFTHENRSELKDIIVLHHQMLEKFGCTSS